VNADAFRIFLASPGGLDDYRGVARAQAEHVRLHFAQPRGIGLDPVGWEDIPPGHGRPQSLINPQLDRCNLLIGILGKRLGTPTGKAESGFVEEYERMAARRLAAEEVDIWIYLVQLDAADLDDPGPELQRVLAFRERLYDEALVKEVRSADHFAMALHQDLVMLVSDADLARDAQSDAISAPIAPARAELKPAGAAEDPATVQLRELLEQAAANAPSAPRDERFGDRFAQVRIGLWLSTWESWRFEGATLDVHQVNRLYLLRRHVSVSAMEGRHVLRTICAHAPAAPGWALLGYDGEYAATELLTLATGDRDASVRAGAFALVDAVAVGDWLARGDVQLDRYALVVGLAGRSDELDDASFAALCDFLARLGGEEAHVFLALFSVERPVALAALVRSIAVTAPALAFELAAGVEALDDETLVALRLAGSAASAAEIGVLAEGLDARLRLLAVELLGPLGRDSAATLALLLADPVDEVAAAAFAAMCAFDQDELDLGALHATLMERKRFDRNDTVRYALARTRTADELVAELDWLDLSTANTYRVLAEDHWGAFAPVVRRDLRERFVTFAEESRTRFVAKIADQILATLSADPPPGFDPALGAKLGKETAEESAKDFLRGNEWNDRRFTIAALAGVARNGAPSDAELVRPLLESEHADIRGAAARALGRVGVSEDVARLVELAGMHGELAAADAAIALSPGPDGAAVTLVGSGRESVAIRGARHLYARAGELSQESVEDLLLRSAHGTVREVGVACALVRLASDELLEPLLERYTEAETYYYNVVFWLDRVLSAPPSLRAGARAELAALAVEERPAPPPPKPLGESTRGLLSQLAAAQVRTVYGVRGTG
jgi:hypothetical protein